jgi:hypothetical protein
LRPTATSGGMLPRTDSFAMHVEFSLDG